jgi:hypothetical protein
MSNINDFKNILHKDLGIKRIGTITQINTGSILFVDFQGRTYMASLSSDIDVKVNDTVIVMDDIVIGKTEIESDPTIFIV